MEYEPYLNKGLTSFEDVIDAFTKYPKGGHWVKKIMKKASFLREIVYGPFTKEQAEQEAEIWKKSFRFKGRDVVKIYSFQELCCQDLPTEDIHEYIYPEYIWKPPPGIDLFCLYNEPERIVIKYDKDTESKSFQKFEKYLANYNISKRIFNEYAVFYHDNNYKSIMAKEIAGRVIVDYRHLPRERELLLHYIMHDELKSDFISIPEYIKNFKNTCYVIYLSYLRELNLCEKNNKIDKFYEKLSDCLPEENKHLSDNKAIFDFYILIGEEDYLIKLFKIYKEEEKYNLLIGDKENYIAIKNIINNRAEIEININISITEFVQYFMQSDAKFTNLMSILALVFYICKCLGINVVRHNIRKINCICDNSGILLYSEIIELLANQEDKLKKLGFVRNKDKELQAKIKKYQKMTVNELLAENDMGDMTLQELAQNISACPYDCQVMDKIIKKIYSEVKSDLVSQYNIGEKNLKYFRAFF